MQRIRAMRPYLLRERLDDTMNTIMLTVKDCYARVLKPRQINTANPGLIKAYLVIKLI